MQVLQYFILSGHGPLIYGSNIRKLRLIFQIFEPKKGDFSGFLSRISFIRWAVLGEKKRKWPACYIFFFFDTPFI